MRFQLKITLRGSRPTVWRRVEVDSNLSLNELHSVIQEVLPWLDDREYVFRKEGREYGNLELLEELEDLEELEGVEDSFGVSISALLGKPMDSLVYEYGLESGWVHDVLLEKVSLDGRDGVRAKLIAGSGACPPDDCGGLEGYASLLAILRDKEHPEYKSKREWLMLDRGEEWDPTDWQVDLEEVNEALEEMIPVLVPDVEGTLLDTDELARFFADYMSKSSLQVCLKVMRVTGISKYGKGELATRFAEEIDRNREVFFELFSVSELYRLQHIAGCTAGQSIPRCSGVLAILAMDKGGPLLRQCVAKTLSKGLIEYLVSPKLCLRKRVEEILLGVQHLYGVLEVDDFCAQAAKYYRLSFTDSEQSSDFGELFFKDYLCSSLSFVATSCEHAHKLYFYSPLLSDGREGVKRILFLRAENKVKRMADFTPDEVMGAGSSDPALELRMAAVGPFLKFLGRYGISETEGELIALTLWVAHNNSIEMGEIISLLLVELKIVLSDEEKMRGAIRGVANGLMTFLNNMPLWELNGATPEAVFKFETKHPGMFSERSFLERGEVEEPREPVVAAGKVSRNDLCPCGSGKKYKKCCGK